MQRTLSVILYCVMVIISCCKTNITTAQPLPELSTNISSGIYTIADSVKVNELHQKAFEYRTTNIRSKEIPDVLQEALRISFAIKYQRGVIKTLALLGLYYVNVNDARNSIFYYKYLYAASQIYHAGRTIPRWKSMANIYGFLGTAYHTGNQFDTAAYYFLKAEQLKIYLHDTTGFVDLYTDLGICFARLDQHKQALYYFKKVEQFASIHKNDEALALALLNIGVYYDSYKDPQTSLAYLQKSLSLQLLSNESKQTAIQYVIASLGDTYIKKHASYSELPYEDLLNNPDTSIRNVLADLQHAKIYTKEQRYDEARTLYHVALGKLLHSNMTFEAVRRYTITLRNIGECYLKLDSPAKALSYIEQSYALTLADPDIEPMIVSEISMARVYTQLKQYKKADVLYKGALQKALDKGFTHHAMSIYGSMARMAAFANHFQDAYTWLAMSKELNDSLVYIEKSQAINLQEKLNSAQTDKVVAQKQLLISKQQTRIEMRNIMLASTFCGILLLSIASMALYRNSKHRRSIHDKHIQILQQEQEIVRLTAMMEGEEKERKRISTELHDGIGGMLASLKMQISALQVKHQQQITPTEYSDVLHTIDETVVEIRKTSHNLMPEVLLKYGFVEAMRMYCNRMQKGKNLAISFQCSGVQEDFDKDFKLSLYRILQELIQNIVKHSQATIADVFINQYENALNILIEDNGIGMDNIASQEGMGLDTIRRRIESMHGSFNVESIPNKGTTIYIQIQRLNSETI